MTTIIKEDIMNGGTQVGWSDVDTVLMYVVLDQVKHELKVTIKIIHV